MAALSSLAGLAYPCRFNMHLAKLEAQVVTGAFFGQDTAQSEFDGRSMAQRLNALKMYCCTLSMSVIAMVLQIFFAGRM